MNALLRSLPRGRLAWWLFVAVFVIGAVVRAIVIATEDGIYWPDEIYQSIEPAHYLAFGYGVLPWEYLQGARGWTFPGAIGGVMWLLSHIGLGDPRFYIRFIRGLFGLMSMISVWAAYRLAMNLRAKELLAVGAAAMWSFAGPAIYFATRALTENAASVCIVTGLALVLSPSARRPRSPTVYVGASLLGLAVACRLHSAVVAILFASFLCLRALETRDRSDIKLAFKVVVVLGLWALYMGALDALTWRHLPNAFCNGWFHSAYTYIKFNYIDNKSVNYGVAPFEYYAQTSWRAMPWIALILTIGTLLAFRNAASLALIVLLFFFLHSNASHKEYRFLMPILPVACAVAAIGFSRLGTRLEGLLAAFFVFAATSALVVTRDFTWGDVGSYPDHATKSAWDDHGPQNRLLLEASQLTDICGVRLDAITGWTGGYGYLHRKAPTYEPPEAGQAQGHYNYIIVHHSQMDSSLEAVFTDGDYVFARLKNANCTPDLSYKWVLQR